MLALKLQESNEKGSDSAIGKICKTIKAKEKNDLSKMRSISMISKLSLTERQERVLKI